MFGSVLSQTGGGVRPDFLIPAFRGLVALAIRFRQKAAAIAAQSDGQRVRTSMNSNERIGKAIFAFGQPIVPLGLQVEAVPTAIGYQTQRNRVFDEFPPLFRPILDFPNSVLIWFAGGVGIPVFRIGDEGAEGRTAECSPATVGEFEGISRFVQAVDKQTQSSRTTDVEIPFAVSVCPLVAGSTRKKRSACEIRHIDTLNGMAILINHTTIQMDGSLTIQPPPHGPERVFPQPAPSRL